MPAITVELADEAATMRLGEDLALALKPGDVLALSGELGAGKTTLARAAIRALADDAPLEVPSPTFTLVQSYDTRPPVHHFDLYRLSSPAEVAELGLEESLGEGAVLIEWPDRAGPLLPADVIGIELTHRSEGRLANVSGSGPRFERIARSLESRGFLERSGAAFASRRHLTGDASARSYELISTTGQPDRMLMSSPPLVLGPPVQNGKAYAEIAHTARSVEAFVALDQVLHKAGVTVPTIYAADLGRGLLLIEHLGNGSFLNEGRPVAERYAAAAELLAMIHGRPWPSHIETGWGAAHVIPPFDRDALLIEAELLIDWYLPFVTGRPAGDALRARFRAAWNRVLDRLDAAETSIVLRDVHSPNIVWRQERQGHDRLGIIDFQDALIGPAAYDVASLALDARVTVPQEIERATVRAYVAARQAAGAFDEKSFAAAYAITAAQRNSKILGIFVRLKVRDGKPAYLEHLPRIRDYLARVIGHPALAEVRELYLAEGLIEAQDLQAAHG